MKNVKVTTEEQGQRLDKFLLLKIKNITRSQLQKKILSKDVLVNDKSAAVHCFLKVDDVVSWNLEKIKERSEPRVDQSEPIEILAETPDFIVINKPAGWLAHRISITDKELSVADWLVQEFPDIKGVGDGAKLRPGIVHRLDRDASGVMVIARNKKMFEFLKDQFKNRTISKTYRAIVWGKLPREEGTIDLPIARAKNAARMAVRSQGSEGREAVTEYLVEKYLGNTGGESHGFSVVKVIIHTGRTHQIRAHFFAIGHPVVGDKVYTSKTYPKLTAGKSGRLFLHSWRLEFTDLAGQLQEFEASVPSEFCEFDAGV